MARQLLLDSLSGGQPSDARIRLVLAPSRALAAIVPYLTCPGLSPDKSFHFSSPEPGGAPVPPVHSVMLVGPGGKGLSSTLHAEPWWSYAFGRMLPDVAVLRAGY